MSTKTLNLTDREKALIEVAKLASKDLQQDMPVYYYDCGLPSWISAALGLGSEEAKAQNSSTPASERRCVRCAQPFAKSDTPIYEQGVGFRHWAKPISGGCQVEIDEDDSYPSPTTAIGTLRAQVKSLESQLAAEKTKANACVGELEQVREVLLRGHTPETDSGCGCTMSPTPLLARDVVKALAAEKQRAEKAEAEVVRYKMSVKANYDNELAWRTLELKRHDVTRSQLAAAESKLAAMEKDIEYRKKAEASIGNELLKSGQECAKLREELEVKEMRLTAAVVQRDAAKDEIKKLRDERMAMCRRLSVSYDSDLTKFVDATCGKVDSLRAELAQAKSLPTGIAYFNAEHEITKSDLAAARAELERVKANYAPGLYVHLDELSALKSKLARIAEEAK